VEVSSPPFLHRSVGDAPALPPRFLCPHLLVVYTVRFPPHHVLKQFGTLRFIAVAPKIPHKVMSTM
jgi:hypothetical protein